MSFSTSAFFLACFLFFVASVLIFVSFRIRNPKGGFFNINGLLIVFAAGYLVLSLYSSLVGFAYVVENNNLAPCENLLDSEIMYYKYGDNFTGYHWDYDTGSAPTVKGDAYVFHEVHNYTYVDSCATRTTPASVERLYVAYAYLLYATILISALGLIFAGFKTIVTKW